MEIVVRFKLFLIPIGVFLFGNLSCGFFEEESPALQPETPAPVVTPSPSVDTSSCPDGYECDEQCRTLFSPNYRKLDECKKLSIQAINELYTSLEERLKSPIRRSELNQISQEHLQDIVNKASDEWLVRIHNYEEFKDGKEVLGWLVFKKGYTDVFFKSSNSVALNLLEELLNSIDSDEGLALRIDLGIGSGGHLQEYSRKRGNLEMMNWAHDLMVKRCPQSQYSRYGSYSKYACVLDKLYCANDEGRSFTEVYRALNDQRLLAFILNGSPGLNMNENDADFLERVCRHFSKIKAQT